MIKAVIFDCYGVIRPDKLILAYEKSGGDYMADKQFIDDTITAANRGLIPSSRTVFADHLGITVDQWMAELNEGVSVDQQLLDFIAGLRPGYRTAVLSNASQGTLQEVIGHQNIARCFDHIVESGSLGYAKPDPEIFHHTAEKLGVPPKDCLFTDDNPDYCQAARATGMQAIYYQSFNQFKHEFDTLTTSVK